VKISGSETVWPTTNLTIENNKEVNVSAFFIVGFILCALAAIGAVCSMAGLFHSAATGKGLRAPIFFGTFFLCVLIDVIGMLTLGGGVIYFITTRF